MKTTRLISRLGLLIVLLSAGCDNVDVTDGPADMIRPRISVHFVNGESSSIQKTGAILDVELVVTNLRGTDYSPEPEKVDDTIQDEVRFDLVLPPDSVYNFRVRFVQNGQLVGEGGVLQLISETSTEVDIPVVTTRNEPWFAIVPAVVDVNTTSGSVDLTMRYYGGSAGIAGLAAELVQTGPDPAEIQFFNVDVVETSGSETSLAWLYDTPLPTGVIDVGLIRVPVSSASEFCIEMNPGDARTVNRQGLVSLIGASGACVNVNE